MRYQFITLLFLCSGLALSTAQTPWRDVSETSFSWRGERRIVPQQYRTVRVDTRTLQQVLSAAPRRSITSKSSPITLQLPLPDGRTGRFQVFETPVMAAALQARYPGIRCYTGQGIDDPSARLKCDLTPQGFHAMITSVKHNTVFIDPYSTGDAEYNVVYYKKDYQRRADAQAFSCGLAPTEATAPSSGVSERGGSLTDGQWRKYRLALSCTGEYATFHGGTKELVLAAMVTSMNRVNGVYENEFAVSMEIIGKNDTLIFLNKDSDPFDNGDGGAMLGQNRTVINQRIGTLGYDMGHVFSTGGGGIAGLGVVCGGNKAHGVTGQASPIGDPFDIDYVAHEMGHQFSGNHTQNNDCNRAGNTAVEPGSGSTIMGYAGICSPDVQMHSDDYFHGVNVEEIVEFITSGGGNTCPEKTANNNNAPVVDAGSDYTIPKGTAFLLTAAGADADGDSLTYCWEQMDNQSAVMPPSTNSKVGPAFRSYLPTPDPVRIFPRLQSLVAPGLPTWERLPNVGRTMKFRVTVRDNNPAGGATGHDDMVLTLADGAGPFRVTNPNALLTWQAGEFQQITWDVANSNLAPVNCPKVNIRLSLDGGFTYPIALAENVDNNGRYCIIAPDTVTNRGRVRVEAVDNIFFDISNTSFLLRKPTKPGFALCATDLPTSACAPSSTSVTFSSNAVLGFDTLIQFSVVGLPAGATADFSPNPAVPGSDVKMTLDFPFGTPEGTYSVAIKAKAGTDSTLLTTKITVTSSDYSGLTLLAPNNGSAALSQAPTLRWNKVTDANQYDVQVSESPTFETSSIRFSKENLTLDSQKTALLEKNKIYFWRIRPKNECGPGNWTDPFVFSTQADDCRTYTANDLPKTIVSAAPNTVESKVTVNAGGPLSDVNIKLIRFNHTFFKTLEWHLIGPGGEDVLLFKDKCGTNSNTYLFGFDGAAATEVSCPPPPSSLTVYKPTEDFSKFTGLNSTGEWTLRVLDKSASDGGNLSEFQIEFCSALQLIAPLLVKNEPLLLPAGTGLTIGTDLLKAEDADNTAEQLTYQLLTLPKHGLLQKGGADLTVGATFTQSDIDNGVIGYRDNDTIPDNFRFIVRDDKNGYAAGVFVIKPKEFVATTAPATSLLSFRLAPNPSSGQTRVSLSQPLQQAAQLRVFNAQGQLVAQATLATGTNAYDLNLNALPAGLYTVRLENAQTAQVQRLAVE